MNINLDNFADCVNVLCSCSIKPETTIFFSALPQLKHQKKILDETLLQLSDKSLLRVLLFGSKIYNEHVNMQILNASIGYIIDSDRFTGSLILSKLGFFLCF